MGKEYTTYESPSRENKSYVNIMVGENIVETIKDIKLPDNFKKVIIKIHPEIEDVITSGFETHIRYDAQTFSPLSFFEINLSVIFKQGKTPNGGKDFYNDSFKSLFKMTYGSDMDFISFFIGDMVMPREKSNEEKFVELFGVRGL